MDEFGSSSQRTVHPDTVLAGAAASLTQSTALPGPKKRKNAQVTPSLPKPKKQKLRRNLDNIIARKELPNVPAAGGVNKSGQRMVKGPYKKREKKDKNGKKLPTGLTPGASVAGVAAGSGVSEIGVSGASIVGGKRGKGPGSGAKATSASLDNSATRTEATPAPQYGTDNDNRGGQKAGLQVETNALSAEGGENAEGKEDEDDDHEEEPEYSEFEWNQEASSRGRNKDDLKYADVAKGDYSTFISSLVS
jgi:hypothetical protein